MNAIDRLSLKIGSYIANNIKHDKHDDKIKGISEDISILKELHRELVKKDEELKLSKIEWDRTFDSIIDNIVIIDKNRCISKYNKSFEKCLISEGLSPDVVGVKWDIFKDMLNIPTNKCSVLECFDKGEPVDVIIPVGGKIYSVTSNPIKDDITDEVLSVIRISRDITAIENQKSKIERRSNIFESIARMSAIVVNHDNWEVAIQEILSILGGAVSAGRVYMYHNEFKNNRLCAIMDSEWTNDHIVYYDSILDCINYDTVPDLMADMLDGKSVKGSIPPCHMCDDYNTEGICSCQHNYDLMVNAVPIYSDKKWWGFIGFDSYIDRPWTTDDESLLRIAADIIGGVIYHRKRYFDAINSLEEYERKTTV